MLSHHKAILLGQLLALIIATTASSSTALARSGISFPALQSSLNYFLLAVVYTIVRLKKNGNALNLSIALPWWQYAAIAFLDVEANFLVVLSFRYTSLTSVTLLDCWSIPVALALTRILSLAAYRKGHYGGAALCVLGLALLVATDQRSFSGGGGGGGGVEQGDDDDAVQQVAGKRMVLGDVLVVLGATLYACCNVLQEHLLGEVEPAELLSLLGMFGLCISLVQAVPFELSAAMHAPWRVSSLGPWLGFGVAMFAFYSFVPYELEWGGAAILNLSLLSADLWTVLARILFFGGFSTAAGGISFGVAFLFVAAGIALYSWSGEVKRGDEMQMEGGKYKKYTSVMASSSEEYAFVGGGGGGGGEDGVDAESGGGVRIRGGGGSSSNNNNRDAASMELVTSPLSGSGGGGGTSFTILSS